MRILRAGKLAKPEPAVQPYWVDYKCRCDKCGIEFVLEATDQVTTLAATERVPRHGEIVCPTTGCWQIHWIEIEPGSLMAVKNTQWLPSGSDQAAWHGTE